MKTNWRMLAISAMAMTLGTLPSLSSMAMGRTVVTDPVADVPVTEPSPTAPAPGGQEGEGGGVTIGNEPRESAGTYEDGYAFGQRNGHSIVTNLVAKTVGGPEGCSALPKLQAALVKVTRSIRAPNAGTGSENDPFVRGYFRGYLDEIRDGVRKSRQGCNAFVHETGGFAGELYGAFLCSVTEVSLELVWDLEIPALYEGWAGRSEQVSAECRGTVELSLRACGNGARIDDLSWAVEASCWDGE